MFTLIREVIKNGFIQDLLPKNNHKENEIDHDMESLKQLIFSINNPNGRDVNIVMSIGKQKFGIFDVMNEKMNLDRYKECVCELKPAHLLALLL